jgi:hypothetical protein
MVQLLLLSINILSIKVAELLAILVGKYTISLRLLVYIRKCVTGMLLGVSWNHSCRPWQHNLCRAKRTRIGTKSEAVRTTGPEMGYSVRPDVKGQNLKHRGNVT